MNSRIVNSKISLVHRLNLNQLGTVTQYRSVGYIIINFKLNLKQNNTIQICNVHICVTITVKLICYLTKRCQKVNVNYER